MKDNEILCLNPNCLAVFPEQKALFVCKEHGQKKDGQEVECTKEGVHFGHSHSYMVFEPHFPWYLRVLKATSVGNCPECGKLTFQRACPQCHSELVGETPQGFEAFKFISMVGAPSSGKTAFLFSLKQHISQLNNLHINCYPYTTLTECWYRDMCNSFRREGGLMPTLRLVDRASPELRGLLDSCGEGSYSLVYKITLGSSEKSKKSVYLISPDPAGEIYTDASREQQCRKLLSKADAIFYFINPLYFEGVRTNNSERSNPSVDHGLILSRISRLLEEDVVSRGKQRRLPFAVIVTHADMLSHMKRINITEFSTEYSESYSVERGEKISKACRKFLEECGADDFVRSVEDNFPTHAFFFTAAFNRDPRVENSQPPFDVKPILVVDPLLWVLWQYGYIKGE